MASTTAPETEAAPEITEAFTADRQRFWSSFTTFVTGGAIAIAVLLMLMLVFLV